MADKYMNFIQSPMGKFVGDKLGLPNPIALDRFTDTNDFIQGPILVGFSKEALFRKELGDLLSESDQPHLMIESLGETEDLKLEIENNIQKPKGIIFDASGVQNATELSEVYEFFHPILRTLKANARIVIVGLNPKKCTNPRQQSAQRALLGFIKALGKEHGSGATVNLIYAENESRDNIKGITKFFLSPKCAYVSGQFVEVGTGSYTKTVFGKALEGKTALITGSARGIGKSIAEVMAREGAKVTLLDIPAAEDDLKSAAKDLGGDYLTLDVTSEDCAQKIAEKFGAEGLDILVHNAGITRDKMLKNMKKQLWDLTLNINLISQENINETLIQKGILRKGSKVVQVSSISGIAGNKGQTNYAASKAGVIGMVEGLAPIYREKGITINAVAPGFIETKMTAAIPLAIREAGRRMNAMSQGGLPVDVAEMITLFASPEASNINGQIVRVCGLGLIGA